MRVIHYDSTILPRIFRLGGVPSSITERRRMSCRRRSPMPHSQPRQFVGFLGTNREIITITNYFATHAAPPSPTTLLASSTTPAATGASLRLTGFAPPPGLRRSRSTILCQVLLYHVVLGSVSTWDHWCRVIVSLSSSFSDLSLSKGFREMGCFVRARTLWERGRDAVERLFPPHRRRKIYG